MNPEANEDSIIPSRPDEGTPSYRQALIDEMTSVGKTDSQTITRLPNGTVRIDY